MDLVSVLCASLFFVGRLTVTTCWTLCCTHRIATSWTIITYLVFTTMINPCHPLSPRYYDHMSKSDIFDGFPLTVITT